jgi:hypothetical protein
MRTVEQYVAELDRLTARHPASHPDTLRLALIETALASEGADALEAVRRIVAAGRLVDERGTGR